MFWFILILAIVLIAGYLLCGFGYKENNNLLERRAKWVNIGHNGTYECSYCGRKSIKSDYCPYCGAIMEGEIND